MSADINHPIVIASDILADKLLDAAVPGFFSECNPEEAEAMGAFSENALTEDDALIASFDDSDQV